MPPKKIITPFSSIPKNTKPPSPTPYLPSPTPDFEERFPAPPPPIPLPRPPTPDEDATDADYTAHATAICEYNQRKREIREFDGSEEMENIREERIEAEKKWKATRDAKILKNKRDIEYHNVSNFFSVF
jgi:hypothetical protein